MTFRSDPAHIAVVDFGLGNLHSVVQACEHAGARTVVTSDHRELAQADGIILPGVGAFGDAMAALKARDLAAPLRDLAQAKPLLGICLGLQLLMDRSHEFGLHEGLGIVAGEVLRLETSRDADGRLNKVPHVGWNRVLPPAGRPEAWRGTPMDGQPDGVFMYFVHSYYVRPESEDVVAGVTGYGDATFCSVLRQGSVFATQFHPERSGVSGLKVYYNFIGSVTGAGCAD
jgi:glutamine amidotransferase